MATIKSIKGGIKADIHIANAIEYITKQEKTKGLVSTFNCYGDKKNIIAQFQYTRQIFGKDKGVLAHHYCHSFSPDDDVTPEQVHKITLDLVQKIAGDNFQYLVATHSDKDHIHSHIIINSVNMLTGKKWLGNQATLKAMRKESDRLCIENNLSIVKEPGKKGMDFTTYQMAMQGKSWKVNLVRDLDEILKNCTTQNEFIKLLEEKGYSVKFTGKNITVTVGQKKIRLTTLAKEFGEKYSSKSIFYQLGMKYDETIKSEKKENASSKHKESTQKTEWQKQEEDFFKNHQSEDTPFLDWNLDKINFEKDPKKFSHDFIEYLEKQRILKEYAQMYTPAQRRWYRISKINSSLYSKGAAETRWEKIQRTTEKNIRNSECGNVSFNELNRIFGENFSIKIFAYQIPSLYYLDCYFNVMLDKSTGIATVTVKEYNKDKLLRKLNLKNEKSANNQNERIRNRERYETIKEQCKRENKKVSYSSIDDEYMLEKLKNEGIYFSTFKKDNELVIAYNPAAKEKILQVISPPIKEYKSEYSKSKDTLDFLEKRADDESVNLSYVTISADLKNKLNNNFKESDKRFAIFKIKGSDNYTLVYLETDMEIKSTLPPKQVQQTKTSTNK